MKNSPHSERWRVPTPRFSHRAFHLTRCIKVAETKIAFKKFDGGTFAYETRHIWAHFGTGLRGSWGGVQGNPLWPMDYLLIETNYEI